MYGNAECSCGMLREIDSVSLVDGNGYSKVHVEYCSVSRVLGRLTRDGVRIVVFERFRQPVLSIPSPFRRQRIKQLDGRSSSV